MQAGSNQMRNQPSNAENNGQTWRTVLKPGDAANNNTNNRTVTAPGLINSTTGGGFRDWEGLQNSYALTQAAMNQAQARNQPAFRQASQQPNDFRVRQVDREGSPSVAVFADSMRRAQAALRNPQAVLRRDGDNGNNSNNGGGAPGAPQQVLVDHQTFLAWKRAEYARRLQCEANNDEFIPQPLPFSKEFEKTVRSSAANGYDADRSIREFGTAITVDFKKRSTQVLAPQVIGTAEEVAWLQRPAIPPPRGWTGTWDTCPGHDVLLQLLAVSGATPSNSPALTRHIMYPDLLSCVQRLSFGSYLVLYDKPGEPPHERFFYIKPLPLANRSQYCPFLCYAQHRKSQTAEDAIPLCNVIWVTPGVHSDNLQRYQVSEGSRYIYGPYVGKKRAEMLNYGAFSVWVYDGKHLRSVDVVATDPLAYEMWMTLLDSVSQINASLDLSNRVRTVQRYIEELKVRGELRELKPEKKPNWFQRVFGFGGSRNDDY